MANFNIGALSDWLPVGAGEVLDFEVPQAGFRVVDFDVIANCMVSIHAVSGESATLVAYSDGMFNVRFSTAEQSAVGFHFPEDGSVYIRTKFRSQEIGPSPEAPFTSIEPRSPTVHSEVQRMMMLAQLHARQREETLLREIAALRERPAQAGNEQPAGGTPEEPAKPVSGETSGSQEVLE